MSEVLWPGPPSPTRSCRSEADLFDFVLTDDDMQEIWGLHRNGRRGPNPDEFNWIP